MLDEFIKLSWEIERKLKERINTTKNVITLISIEKNFDTARLKNIMDTNIFRFDKIKKLLIEMEKDNSYLSECYYNECKEKVKCANQ